MVKRKSHILPAIIFSQFSGTSLWFAGNAVITDLQMEWGLGEHILGYVTSAVQLGFILGTLVFAYLAIADRFSPRRVFFFCSIAGAVANGALLFVPEQFASLVVLRFATGFFLAGIYPVGMKIAAGWYEQGLGRALGYLVGALVLGTAFPHLIRGMGAELAWQQVLSGVSVLAVAGGVLMLKLVPDGPYLAQGSPFNPRTLSIIFRSKSYRASAFGYFGHMWELYTFWAFIPVWLLSYSAQMTMELDVSLWAFFIIAIGAAGCVVGGTLSARFGSARVAGFQLSVSGLCCLLSPLFFTASPVVFIAFLIVWGISVIGDSPQFSALNAVNAPKEYVGSALTIANCIGFFITVISIQLVNTVYHVIGPQYIFWLLIPGPVLGVLALRPLLADR